MRGRPVKSILCIVAAVLLVSGTAHAAADVGTVDQMLQQFQTHASGWGASLRSLALNSFYILAVIDIALAAIGWAFRGGDLGDFLAIAGRRDYVSRHFLGTSGKLGILVTGHCQ